MIYIRFDIKKYIDKIDFQKSSFWLILLGAVFLISAATYLYSPVRKINRVVFYYHESKNVIEGEKRRVRPKGSKEKNIEALVKEIALGPQLIFHKAIMPASTRINSIMLREKALYIDFSNNLLFDKEDIEYNLNDVIFVVNKTVKFNFPWIKEIIITVNGEQPVITM